MKKVVSNNIYKILIPLLVVWGAVTIFKAGHAFGVWLSMITH